jgi:hypothetical protein
VLPQEHQPVCTDAEAAGAVGRDGGLVELWEQVAFPIVEEEEVVAGAVVLVESNSLDVGH